MKLSSLAWWKKTLSLTPGDYRHAVAGTEVKGECVVRIVDNDKKRSPRGPFEIEIIETNENKTVSCQIEEENKEENTWRISGIPAGTWKIKRLVDGNGHFLTKEAKKSIRLKVKAVEDPEPSCQKVIHPLHDKKNGQILLDLRTEDQELIHVEYQKEGDSDWIPVEDKKTISNLGEGKYFIRSHYSGDKRLFPMDEDGEHKPLEKELFAFRPLSFHTKVRHAILGGNAGEITLSQQPGQGKTEKYEYTWSHDPSTKGPKAENLSAATYSVTIRGIDSGQEIKLEEEVLTFPRLKIEPTKSIHAREGQENGELQFEITGGDPSPDSSRLITLEQWDSASEKYKIFREEKEVKEKSLVEKELPEGMYRLIVEDPATGWEPSSLADIDIHAFLPLHPELIKRIHAIEGQENGELQFKITGGDSSPDSSRKITLEQWDPASEKYKIFREEKEVKGKSLVEKELPQGIYRLIVEDPATGWEPSSLADIDIHAFLPLHPELTKRIHATEGQKNGELQFEITGGDPSPDSSRKITLEQWDSASEKYKIFREEKEVKEKSLVEKELPQGIYRLIVEDPATGWEPSYSEEKIEVKAFPPLNIKPTKSIHATEGKENGELQFEITGGDPSPDSSRKITLEQWDSASEKYKIFREEMEVKGKSLVEKELPEGIYRLIVEDPATGWEPSGLADIDIHAFLPLHPELIKRIHAIEGQENGELQFKITGGDPSPDSSRLITLEQWDPASEKYKIFREEKEVKEKSLVEKELPEGMYRLIVEDPATGWEPSYSEEKIEVKAFPPLNIKPTKSIHATEGKENGELQFEITGGDSAPDSSRKITLEQWDPASEKYKIFREEKEVKEKSLVEKELPQGIYRLIVEDPATGWEPSSLADIDIHAFLPLHPELTKSIHATEGQENGELQFEITGGDPAPDSSRKITLEQWDPASEKYKIFREEKEVKEKSLVEKELPEGIYRLIVEDPATGWEPSYSEEKIEVKAFPPLNINPTKSIHATEGKENGELQFEITGGDSAPDSSRKTTLEQWNSTTKSWETFHSPKIVGEHEFIARELPKGEYRLKIEDPRTGWGPIYSEKEVKIQAFPDIKIERKDHIPATIGQEDGQLQFTVTGGGSSRKITFEKWNTSDSEWEEFRSPETIREEIYSATNLPEGTYRLIVEAPGTGWQEKPSDKYPLTAFPPLEIPSPVIRDSQIDPDTKKDISTGEFKLSLQGGKGRNIIWTINGKPREDLKNLNKISLDKLPKAEYHIVAEDQDFKRSKETTVSLNSYPPLSLGEAVVRHRTKGIKEGEIRIPVLAGSGEYIPFKIEEDHSGNSLPRDLEYSKEENGEELVLVFPIREDGVYKIKVKDEKTEIEKSASAKEVKTYPPVKFQLMVKKKASCDHNDGILHAAFSERGSEQLCLKWTQDAKDLPENEEKLEGVKKGTYKLLVTDKYTGYEEEDEITLASHNPLEIHFSREPIYKEEESVFKAGKLQVIVTGGSGTYDYKWYFCGGKGEEKVREAIPNADSPIREDEREGKYEVLVTDRVTQCQKTANCELLSENRSRVILVDQQELDQLEKARKDAAAASVKKLDTEPEQYFRQKRLEAGLDTQKLEELFKLLSKLNFNELEMEGSLRKAEMIDSKTLSIALNKGNGQAEPGKSFSLDWDQEKKIIWIKSKDRYPLTELTSSKDRLEIKFPFIQKEGKTESRSEERTQLRLPPPRIRDIDTKGQLIRIKVHSIK
jgi:hypothetical protein